jgi:OOP family OmpA-OmpF porin
MKPLLKRISIASTIAACFVGALAYADTPDPYQNSATNNISYDLSSKFYAGANIGYGMFSGDSVTVSGNKANIDANSIDFGLFTGYKINRNFAVEANFQRLGKLTDKGGSSSLPLSYNATIYNLSADVIASYPIDQEFDYTVSIYGKGGYGINFTNYDYNANNGAAQDSGNMDKGAYNFGLGVNLDFRSNISARLGYTYYQVHYPLPGHSSNNSASIFSLGLYYNFS